MESSQFKATFLYTAIKNKARLFDEIWDDLLPYDLVWKESEYANHEISQIQVGSVSVFMFDRSAHRECSCAYLSHRSGGCHIGARSRLESGYRYPANSKWWQHRD